MKSATTRDRIIEAAKALYYERGFKNTLGKDIAAKAEVPVSLLSYYFKTKEGLPSVIQQDFHDCICARIDAYEEEHFPITPMIKIMLWQYIGYDIILTDEKNKRFYRELRESFPFHYEISGINTSNEMRALIQEYHITLSEDEAKAIPAMVTSAYGGFFYHYFKDDPDMSTLMIVSIVAKVLPSCLGIDAAKISEALVKCFQIVRNIDYSDIKFL